MSQHKSIQEIGIDDQALKGKLDCAIYWRKIRLLVNVIGKWKNVSAESQRRWLYGDDADADPSWKTSGDRNAFVKNADSDRLCIVHTSETPWVTSNHCFQCALNTVHVCDDQGKDIHTFPGILRKWISAQIYGGNMYPTVRYIVNYPPNTPPLPHHDHPGGEEYVVLTGDFSDSRFGDIPAPAYVRYPVGSDHGAMKKQVKERTEILTWWGMIKSDIENEEPSHVPLCPRTLVPKDAEPTLVVDNGHRKIWPLSPADGIETRIERWDYAGDSAFLLDFQHPIKEIFLLRGNNVTMKIKIPSPLFSEDKKDEDEPVASGTAPVLTQKSVLLSEGVWCYLPHTCDWAEFMVGADGATVIVKEMVLEGKTVTGKTVTLPPAPYGSLAA